MDASGTTANVTFVADYDGAGRASSEQAFVVNTGSGNDNITADLTGTSTSGSTQASLSISSTGGNNTVELTSTGAEVNTATVTLGAGNDTVTGGMTHLTANTGAGDDVVYAENTGTKTEGILAAGSTIASAVAFAAVGASGQAVNEVELLNGRTVTVTLNITNLAAADTLAFTKGYEATAVIEASNGALTTERDLYEAAAKAINEDAVLNKLAKAEVDSNGDLIVTSLVDGVSVAGDDLVTLGLSGVATDLSAAERADILEAVQDKIDDSTETAGNVDTAYDGVALAVTDVVDVTTIGTDSTVSGGSNTVNAGAGDDVIVLNSNAADTLSDTVVFDAGQIGNNAIVHFETVAGASAEDDVLDFTAWLNNTTDASANANNLSESRVLTTLAASEAAFDENAVVITDFNTLNGATTAVLDFANMTDAQVLAALNENATFANVAADANLVGNAQNSIMMVENVANLGEYKVYQVTSETALGDDNFTAVTLIGTVDFGATVGFEVDNFA
ncbi:MAG: hypothetical protein GYB41_16995 [Oceanospirillales bacterium]|nr:hypothetical protein [Oceanospirillales bacterium]